MKIRILGSAAGGGFPQWNCYCRNCRGVRDGSLRARARTQSSIIVRGADPCAWVLVNASPDVLSQLRAYTDLQPGRSTRDSALRAIVLMDAQIDHVTGLLMLRESQHRLDIWATPRVQMQLTSGLPIFGVLSHYCGVTLHDIDPGKDAFEVAGVGEIRWRAFAVQGKAPPYCPIEMGTDSNNIALEITDAKSNRSVVYAPGISAITPALWDAMTRADAVLVDGTCWTDDELSSLGISTRRARDMGHLALHGRGGMIEWLCRLPAATRKVLVHINNTNPILDEDSNERAELVEHGIEVAHDGMEFEL